MNSTAPTGSKHKPRIFLAYYARATKPESYHVAVVVRHHPLVHESVNTLRLHATNKIKVPTAENPDSAREVWAFEAKQTRFISQRLTGLLYLGKLPKGKSVNDVTKICASVPVAPDGVVGWRCSNWVWDAIQRLAEEDIIPPLPCSSEELYKKGRDHILETRKQNPHEVVGIDTEMRPYDFSV